MIACSAYAYLFAAAIVPLASRTTSNAAGACCARYVAVPQPLNGASTGPSNENAPPSVPPPPELDPPDVAHAAPSKIAPNVTAAARSRRVILSLLPQIAPALNV